MKKRGNAYNERGEEQDKEAGPAAASGAQGTYVDRGDSINESAFVDL